MKITLVTDDLKVSIEYDRNDLNIEDVTQLMLRPLLLAAGYQPDNVEDYIPST